MNNFITYLEETIPEKDSLKLVKTEAQKFYHSNSLEECLQTGYTLWEKENFQLQEVGVLLLGYCAHQYPDALSFLRKTVSRHKSWKVQEILAMAFDNHCKIVGYKQALPLIQEWINDDNANVRRAVSEGLRIPFSGKIPGSPWSFWRRAGRMAANMCGNLPEMLCGISAEGIRS